MRLIALQKRGGTVMVEYRKHPRHRTLKGGKIIFNRRLTVMDCIIRNMSAGGACLEVAAPAALPKRFVLLHGKTKKSCLVVWKVGRRLGVSF